jgi:hypothetical protein
VLRDPAGEDPLGDLTRRQRVAGIINEPTVQRPHGGRHQRRAADSRNRTQQNAVHELPTSVSRGWQFG